LATLVHHTFSDTSYCTVYAVHAMCIWSISVHVIVVVLFVECIVEANEVQGKCSVVFGEEVEDLGKFFLEKQDAFWFLEVSMVVYE